MVPQPGRRAARHAPGRPRGGGHASPRRDGDERADLVGPGRPRCGRTTTTTRPRPTARSRSSCSSGSERSEPGRQPLAQGSRHRRCRSRRPRTPPAARRDRRVRRGPGAPTAGAEERRRNAPWAIATPASTIAAPAGWYHSRRSSSTTTPTIVATTGITYVTVEAVLAPASRMLRVLITNARPVPSAPSARTDQTTSADRLVGAGGSAGDDRRDDQQRGRSR